MTEYGFRNKVKSYVNLSPTDNYSEIDMVFRKKKFHLFHLSVPKHVNVKHILKQKHTQINRNKL
jgi:hypothetical protein